MGFKDMKYEKAGYPLYKAYVVPYREGENLLNIREVKAEDIDIWRNVLEKLMEFLSKSLDFARKSRGKMNNEEELELICDLIAVFFKLPLLREILPSLMPNPLKGYLLYRLIGLEKISEENIKDTLKFTKMIYSKEIVEELSRIPIIDIFSDAEICRNIELCWFIFPADTRPGYNISGLLPHLLLTSSLAWSLAVNRGFDRKKAVMLRLTAMLHDMGKPFRYADHVRASVEVAEILLANTEYVEEIKDYVKRHHAEADTEEASILSQADKFASSIDRLSMLVQNIIGGKINSIAEKINLKYEDAYGRGYASWEFWRKAEEQEPNSVKELSELFVKKLQDEIEGYSKPLTRISGEPIQDLELVAVDIGEIQRFIFKRNELRCMVAASLAIDCCTISQIPILLQNYIMHEEKIWIPYEAILYSAGGMVELILPRMILDSLRRIIEEIRPLSLRVASSQLNTSYLDTFLSLIEKMQSEKFRMKVELNSVVQSKEQGIWDLCDFCYSEVPTDKILTAEGERKVCSTCHDLYDIGSEQHFKRRYDSKIKVSEQVEYTPHQVFGFSWDEGGGEKIIELIAGHDERELDRLETGGSGVLLRNISAIKLDGNLIGSFMGTCVSISDMYERSTRIDLALKKSAEEALEVLFKGILNITGDEKEAARAVISVKLGLVYAGGDDALILLPSWVSPVFAVVLGKEFRSNLGGARGLSIGVASAPARADVWGLISAASELLKKAKDSTRKNPSLSAISFDIVETGGISDSSVRTRSDLLRSRLLSSQPFMVEGEGRTFSWLLSLVIGEFSSYEGWFGKSFILSRFPEICNGSLKEKCEENQQRAKRIKSDINKALSVANSRVNSDEYIPLVARVYLERQILRMGGKRRESLEVVRELVAQEFKEPCLFADVMELIDVLGGGVL
jgi:hypothetical protein